MKDQQDDGGDEDADVAMATTVRLMIMINIAARLSFFLLVVTIVRVIINNNTKHINIATFLISVQYIFIVIFLYP